MAGSKPPEAASTVLGQLPTGAVRNGIDPEGRWEYRARTAGRDWAVMVLELEKQAGSD